jgi:hypothetical protein
MPVETIKCRECGSADVTEFKPGSYVCGHCEAIFKHAMSGDATGGCQVDDCGVPAVGRCASCGRRFCKTHQAVEVSPMYQGQILSRYDDRCTGCQAEQSARIAAQKREEQQLDLASARVRVAAVRDRTTTERKSSQQLSVEALREQDAATENAVREFLKAAESIPPTMVVLLQRSVTIPKRFGRTEQILQNETAAGYKVWEEVSGGDMKSRDVQAEVYVLTNGQVVLVAKGGITAAKFYVTGSTDTDALEYFERQGPGGYLTGVVFRRPGIGRLPCRYAPGSVQGGRIGDVKSLEETTGWFVQSLARFLEAQVSGP